MGERIDVIEPPEGRTLEISLCDHPYRLQGISVNGRELDMAGLTKEEIRIDPSNMIGTLAGVALIDIPSNATGSVQVEEVFILPKTASEAITAGSVVYQDASTKLVTTTDESNTRIGVAAYAAAADDPTVKVKLNA